MPRLRLSSLLVPLLLLGCDTRSRRAERYVDSLRAAHAAEWAREREALLAELPRREAQWAASGPRSYRYRAGRANVVTRYVGDVTVRPGAAPLVRDTTGALLDSTATAVLAVDVPGLFRRIHEALADTAYLTRVQFDSTLGFPTLISVDHKRMSDIGYGHSASRFRALPAGRER